MKKTDTSVAATGSALIAFAALYITSGGHWLLALLALALVWTHVVPVRFPRASFAVWIVRLIAFGTVAAAHVSRPGIGADWLFDAKSVNTVGLICATELVLQAWREPPAGSSFNGVIVLLAGMVFLAACNTFDDRYVRFFTPLYIGATLLSLNQLQQRPRSMAASRADTIKRPVSLGIVLLCGAAIHGAVSSHRSELMRWGIRSLNLRMIPRLSGLSARPSLGSSYDFGDSPERVLLIDGVPADGHLRAAAYDRYEGGTWGPPLDDRHTETLVTPEPLSTEVGQPRRLTIKRLLDNHGVLCAPLNTSQLIADGVEWDAEDGGPLRTLEAPPSSYTLIEALPDYQGMLCPPLTPLQKSRYLSVTPEVRPAVHALALDITREAVGPADRIQAVVQYLQSHHKYSRRARRGGGDPVSNFLLGHRNAHCEYFASAAVILLRCAGIPSRYVVGYYAHEDAGAGRTIVRQRDAHAWAESWVEGVGWTTVEATPSDGTPLAKPQIAPWRRLTEWLQDEMQLLRSRLATFSQMQLYAIMLTLVAVWLLTRYRHLRKRPVTSDFTYTPPDAELLRLRLKFEKALRRQGISCPPNLTWSEYLGRYAPSNQKPAPDLEQQRAFAALYNQHRFGKKIEAERKNDLAELLNRVSHRL